MSDADIIDTIAAALNGRGNFRLGSDLRPEAARILAALRERYAVTPYEGLKANRFVIVELPEPPLNVLIGGEPESVYVSDRLDEPSITISGTVSIYADEAPALAAALLAAAEEGK